MEWHYWIREKKKKDGRHVDKTQIQYFCEVIRAKRLLGRQFWTEGTEEGFIFCELQIAAWRRHTYLYMK